jgi:hypothetical protein
MLVDVFVVPDPIFVPREGVQPRAVAVLLGSLPKKLEIVGATFVVKAYLREEVVSVSGAEDGIESLREGFDVEVRCSSDQLSLDREGPGLFGDEYP